MDFGLLPPEVNSGRMYAGPGSGPMLAAAAAWDELAAQLYSTAASYRSVVSDLVAGWRGPSSAAMVAAAAPYAAWMSATAAQAEGTAIQTRAAVAAYETAFAVTLPPPVIAANRALLMSLIATNLLGQNTPAIAATEFHYAEMWAQDATAMYAYAGSAATASQLTPFGPPPRTTNPVGSAGQTGAVAQAAGTVLGTHTQALPHAMSATPQALQSLAAPMTSAPTDPSSAFSTIDSFITGPFSPLSLYKLPAVAQLLAAQCYMLPQAVANLLGAEHASPFPVAAGAGLLDSGLGTGTHLVGSASPSGISAGIGRADLAGRLSVPQAWTSAAPAMKTAAAMVPQSSPVGAAAPAAFAANAEGGLFSNMPLSSLSGRAMGGGGAVRSAGVRGAVAVGESAAAGTVSNIFVLPEVDE